MLPHLVSNWECLEISASLSISWTTLYCMVLVSSCRSLRAHFLPRTSDSLFFLGWHILSVCCHFLLNVLGYAHWLCSFFFIFFTYHGLDTSFFGWLVWFYFQPDFHYRKVKDRFSHSHHFWDVHIYHLIIFLYWAWVESESEIFCYRCSIDLMTVLFFTPHSFFGSLIEIL